MAADSGTDLAGYQAQLKTTHLFWTPADTLTFISSPDLAKTMQRWRSSRLIKGCWVRGAERGLYRHDLPRQCHRRRCRQPQTAL
jgi:NitT/TauT family transport system substrate-binding protein